MNDICRTLDTMRERLEESQRRTNADMAEIRSLIDDVAARHGCNPVSSPAAQVYAESRV